VGKSPAVAPRASDAAVVALRHSNRLLTIDGSWTGRYNRTRPLRLVIRKSNGETFRGAIEYPLEATVTTMQGAVHRAWSEDDPIWAQITGEAVPGESIAVSFRETGYERKGSSSISFDGEYRAVATGRGMTGAWFSGSRLVGSFSLEREFDSTGAGPTSER
jgi:hypothetical protein